MYQRDFFISIVQLIIDSDWGRQPDISALDNSFHWYAEAHELHWKDWEQTGKLGCTEDKLSSI